MLFNFRNTDVSIQVPLVCSAWCFTGVIRCTIRNLQTISGSTVIKTSKIQSLCQCLVRSIIYDGSQCTYNCSFVLIVICILGFLGCQRKHTAVDINISDRVPAILILFPGTGIKSGFHLYVDINSSLSSCSCVRIGYGYIESLSIFIPNSKITFHVSMCRSGSPYFQAIH